MLKKYLKGEKIKKLWDGFKEDLSMVQLLLGSRSIFMSPTRAENKDILNERVKHREGWRPFAGIIREEDVADYFEEGFCNSVICCTVKHQRQIKFLLSRMLIRHVVFKLSTNLRIQDYHELLTTLDPPVVVNTSFNDNGEPIVESPYHAVQSFLNMDIDCLVIGDYIVDK